MPDPHKPLRDDVRMLGELLGETLRQRGGDALFATVERVRALAKSGRAETSGKSNRSHACSTSCLSRPPCRWRVPFHIS